MSLTISLKLLYQIVRALLRFVDPKPLDCSVWLVAQIGIIIRLLMFKSEKRRIFGLFGITQISVQQNNGFTQQILVF